MKHTEIIKVRSWLRSQGVRYSVERLYDGYRLRVGNFWIIQHKFSFGLEMLVVRGHQHDNWSYLTAEKVITELEKNLLTNQ